MSESEKLAEDSDWKEKPKEPQTSAPEDDDFEPTADMMIHDFDDESTLNEDDDADIETNEDELADLAKEGEMPIEELLALYYGGANNENENIENNEDQKPQNSQDENNEGETPRRSLRSASALLNPNISGSDSSDDETTHFQEEERKKPRIGEEYQVSEIPEKDSTQNCAKKEEDNLVWKPSCLPEDVVEHYLIEVANESTKTSNRSNSPTFIQDNEDALFLLSQSSNNPEEALKRLKARPAPLKNEMQVWSEEECKQFEDGLTAFGKDFFMIHLNKVRTKSVRDIVKFYYIWKKSERYDHFNAKTRLGKKKEAMQADVTDYMDKLLDETDNACTSSMLNHATGSLLKYYTAAHSIALMEHLKQLEATKDSVSDREVAHILSATVELEKTDVELASSSSGTSQKDIQINNNNNSTEGIPNDSNVAKCNNVVEETSSVY